MTQTTAAKTWGETSGPETPERKDIERLKIAKDASATVRLIGNVLPRYVYWVTTSEGKRIPVECLEFDRGDEKFDPNAKNPFNEIPENIFGEKAQFAYVCNVIDRSDNTIKLLDLKRTMYTQIKDFVNNPEYGSPADETKGYDITIKKEGTGPKPQNVKYSCMPGRSSTPLTPKEKELELYDLNKIFSRQTYDDQKQWLVQNTVYFAGIEGDDLSGETSEDLE